MVTLKHIAKLAKVSSATVSRVNNGMPGVKKETRERVLEILNLVHYTPNILAKGLVSKQIKCVGIAIPRHTEYVFTNPFYYEILRGIGRIARQYKYRLLLLFEEEESYVSIYNSRIVSGILVISNRLNDERILELDKHNVPTVLIPGLINKSRIPFVDVDNYDGALRMTQYLISLGHKNIAFLGGVKESKYFVQRLDGFKRAHQEHNLFINEQMIIETNFTESEAFEAMKILIRSHQLPTAMICINMATTIGVLLAINKNGLKVPDDISLAGFGSMSSTRLVNPPLTIIEEPFYEVGIHAMRLLIDLISGVKRKKWNVVLPVKINLNSSTSALSR